MIIYRVEGRNGNGPYMFPGYIQTMVDGLKHPLPRDDGIDMDKITAFHIFGFASLTALLNWFDLDTRKHLRQCYFSILVYEVPDTRVLVGNRQVVFDRDHAREITILDIVHLS